ncbi:MAG: hypothetical protein ABMA13_05430 [Chthoniobacteraceae bacterium]
MPEPNTQPPIFSDNSSTTLDDKLRVTIPARWRRTAEGGEEFFLTVARSGSFIHVMPPPVFASVFEKLADEPGVTTKEISKFERIFYSRSRHVTTDKAGRIAIPADYAKAVGIKKEVVLAGNRVKFELYSPEAWERTQLDDTPTFDRLADRLDL